MDKRNFLFLLTGILALTLFGFISGCGKTPVQTRIFFNPYVAKSASAPEVVHCFSTIGHKRGTSPFILGGTCCCTPTQELLDMYHEDGFLLDYDLAMLLKEYEKRGIVLEHENGWQCNNQCQSGPHVVFGEKCMTPPTTGTQNFENVITGKKPQ